MNTTYMRKTRNIALVLGLIAYASPVNAEDYYQPQPQAQTQTQARTYANTPDDQQYRLPPAYQGKYYPNDETAIGYHGTTRTSQNDQSIESNHSYYYYYQ